MKGPRVAGRLGARRGAPPPAVSRTSGARETALQRLYRFTVPGLSMSSDFAAARARLLSAFPEIEEVIATTAPSTLLVLSHSPARVDAWLQELRGLRGREGCARRGPLRTPCHHDGGDSAA